MITKNSKSKRNNKPYKEGDEKLELQPSRGFNIEVGVFLTEELVAIDVRLKHFE